MKIVETEMLQHRADDVLNEECTGLAAMLRLDRIDGGMTCVCPRSHSTGTCLQTYAASMPCFQGWRAVLGGSAPLSGDRFRRVIDLVVVSRSS